MNYNDAGHRKENRKPGVSAPDFAVSVDQCQYTGENGTIKHHAYVFELGVCIESETE